MFGCLGDPPPPPSALVDPRQGVYILPYSMIIEEKVIVHGIDTTAASSLQHVVFSQ